MYLENNHCISVGRFDKNFCDNIIKQGEKNSLKIAKLDKQLNVSKARNSKISWLQSDELSSKILPVIYEHNKKAKWNFNIKEMEPFQYTIYEPGQYYDWHIDSLVKPYDNGLIRKISFTICLNEDYTGGELEISKPNPKPEKHLNTKLNGDFITGTIVSFPSFIWHKVNPVLVGTRKVLVGWSLGPSFQ
jgi:PKHD-type hydroxylase